MYGFDRRINCDVRRKGKKIIRLLKRGVRAAARQTYYENDLICGWPISTWLSLVEESYSFGMAGYQFFGWPDGQSLMEQEQCTVEIFKIILVETMKDMADGTKKRNSVQR